METRTDWLGQDYGVGDYVAYAVMAGSHSAEMALGQVEEFLPNGNVRILGIHGAKGKHYYGRTRYIDNRTGKGIRLFPGCKHETKPSYYSSDNYPGVEFTYDQTREKVYNRTARWDEFSWNPPTYHDYVEKVDDPTSRVILRAHSGVKTITKIDYKPEREDSDQTPTA